MHDAPRDACQPVGKGRAAGGPCHGAAPEAPHDGGADAASGSRGRSAPLGVMTGLTADGLERSAGARPREERKALSRGVSCVEALAGAWERLTFNGSERRTLLGVVRDS